MREKRYGTNWALAQGVMHWVQPVHRHTQPNTVMALLMTVSIVNCSYLIIFFFFLKLWGFFPFGVAVIFWGVIKISYIQRCHQAVKC